jgi:hypothetical protein
VFIIWCNLRVQTRKWKPLNSLSCSHKFDSIFGTVSGHDFSIFGVPIYSLILVYTQVCISVESLI